MSEPAHLIEAKRIYKILETESPIFKKPTDAETELYKMDMRTAYENLCDEVARVSLKLKTDLDGYFLSVWETLEAENEIGLLVVLSNQPPGDLPIAKYVLNETGEPAKDDKGQFITEEYILPGDIQPKRATVRTDLYQMEAPRVCPFWFGELGLMTMLHSSKKEPDGSAKKELAYFVYMLYSAGAAEADMEGIRAEHHLPTRDKTDSARSAIDIRMFEQQRVIAELSIGQADFYKSSDHQFKAAVEDERKSVQAEYLRRSKRRGEAEQKSLADRTFLWLERNMKWLILLAIVIIIAAMVIYIVNMIFNTGGGSGQPDVWTGGGIIQLWRNMVIS